MSRNLFCRSLVGVVGIAVSGLVLLPGAVWAFEGQEHGIAAGVELPAVSEAEGLAGEPVSEPDRAEEDVPVPPALVEGRPADSRGEEDDLGTSGDRVVEFVVDPGEAERGETVRITGECTFHGFPATEIYAFFSYDGPDPAPEFRDDIDAKLEVGSNGETDEEVLIPEDARPGPYKLGIMCLSDDQAFGYRGFYFTVLGEGWTPPTSTPPTSPPPPTTTPTQPPTTPPTNAGNGARLAATGHAVPLATSTVAAAAFLAGAASLAGAARRTRDR